MNIHIYIYTHTETQKHTHTYICNSGDVNELNGRNPFTIYVYIK